MRKDTIMTKEELKMALHEYEEEKALMDKQCKNELADRLARAQLKWSLIFAIVIAVGWISWRIFIWWVANANGVDMTDLHEYEIHVWGIKVW